MLSTIAYRLRYLRTLKLLDPEKKHPTGLFVQRHHNTGKNQKIKVSQNSKENYISQTESLLDLTQLINLQLPFTHVRIIRYYRFCYDPKVRFWSSRSLSLFWKKKKKSSNGFNIKMQSKYLLTMLHQVIWHIKKK